MATPKQNEGQGQEQTEKNANFFAAMKDTFLKVRGDINEQLGKAEAFVEPIMRDGYLKAAFRQGADEIGEALKAFPSSIQAQEAGTVFSPTQGEIAAERKAAPSPSQIVQQSRQEQVKGGVHGEKSKGGLEAKSPSEILKAARDSKQSSPDSGKEQGQEQDRGGRELER